jgi:outer membrane protein assembly factor BamB
MEIYYIDGKKFIKSKNKKIPWDYISSPDEQTPAYEDTLTGEKIWCKKLRAYHRLTGPAEIFPDGKKYFYLNSVCYYNDIKYWLSFHPNQDNAFQIEMLLKWS